MRSMAHFDLHVARLHDAMSGAPLQSHTLAVRRRRARARLSAIPPPWRRAIGFRLVEAGLHLALDERAEPRDLQLARQ